MTPLLCFPSDLFSYYLMLKGLPFITHGMSHSSLTPFPFYPMVFPESLIHSRGFSHCIQIYTLSWAFSWILTFYIQHLHFEVPQGTLKSTCSKLNVFSLLLLGLLLLFCSPLLSGIPSCPSQPQQNHPGDLLSCTVPSQSPNPNYCPFFL